MSSCSPVYSLTCSSIVVSRCWRHCRREACTGLEGSPVDMAAMDDFVAEVATLAEANPHVRSMVERLPRIRTEDEAEVHRLVHYCLLLHLLTKGRR